MNVLGGRVGKCRCGAVPSGQQVRVFKRLAWPVRFVIACKACKFGFRAFTPQWAERKWNQFQARLWSRHSEAQFLALRRKVMKSTGAK